MDAAQFVKQVGKLPSLPTLYYELTRAVDDPNSSMKSIGDIVRKDQSLASRLLRLANSAFYSFPSQVTTIEQSLQLIGLREMRDLALATCVLGLFKNLPANLVSAPEFWRHSIATGVASSLMAEKRRDPTPERFFVGGLLHDIGRLIMYIYAPKESEIILQRYETDNMSVCKVECAVLGFDHTDLGAELLTSWKIPGGLVNMVRGHHYPALWQATVVDEATVHCADFITTGLGMGSSGETSVSPLLEEAATRCVPAEEKLEPLIADIEARTFQLCSILGTDSHG